MNCCKHITDWIDIEQNYHQIQRTPSPPAPGISETFPCPGWITSPIFSPIIIDRTRQIQRIVTTIWTANTTHCNFDQLPTFRTTQQWFIDGECRQRAKNGQIAQLLVPLKSRGDDEFDQTKTPLNVELSRPSIGTNAAVIGWVCAKLQAINGRFWLLFLEMDFQGSVKRSFKKRRVSLAVNCFS